MRFGRLIRGAARRAGYEVARPAPDFLHRLRRVDLAPASVLDVGAALGDWTRVCAKTFPTARYVLIEPLTEFAPALADAVRGLDAAVVHAAAAATPGERTFNVHRDLVGSSLLGEREGGGVDGVPRTVPATTIDAVVAEHGLEPPFLVKLDVQGAELDVLSGASKTLERAVAFLAEASFFDFFFGGATFDRLIAAAAERGFVVYDIPSLARRPVDGALAQGDFVFVPRVSPLRAFHGFASPTQRAAQDVEFARTMRRRVEAAQRRT